MLGFLKLLTSRRIEISKKDLEILITNPIPSQVSNPQKSLITIQKKSNSQIPKIKIPNNEKENSSDFGEKL
jgi:hypothetical protein